MYALEAPKRNHFFYGKLLDELHLRLEQDYLNRKRWLLNRTTLGYGVVCELQVDKDGKTVVVESGVAINRYGRRSSSRSRSASNPSKISTDCRTTRDRAADESTVYLWLCYRECKADFVPALVTDCQSRDESAPSTIVESYCFDVTTKAPTVVPAEDEALCKALRDGTTADEKRDLINAALQRDCPCGEDHGCIPLATIDLDDTGVVTKTDIGPQPRVYGNDTLFKMLLCLHESGGQGPKGDPGLGLNPDLPKILDIAWQHNRLYLLLHDTRHARARLVPAAVS